MIGKKGECIGVRRQDMARSKFIPLPDHPAMVKCAVTKCGRVRPIAEMLNLGNNIFACKTHRASTRMKGIPRQNDMSPPCTHPDNVSKKRWKIDARITGEIEEV